MSLSSVTGCVSASKYHELEDQSASQSKDLEALESKSKAQELLIAELQSKLGTASKDKGALKSSVDEMQKALADLQKRQAEAERQLADFRALQASLKSMVDAGTLDVRIIGGRIVVNLGSDVLFTSGSAQLSAKGKAAVEAVTAKLAALGNKEFQIEGHTDSIPIKSSIFASNWELASARALAVVTTMRKAGMAASRLSAASYAETKPVRPNDSPDGRAQNRRIAIALVPDLSSLAGFDQLNAAGKEADAKSADKTPSGQSSD